MVPKKIKSGTKLKEILNERCINYSKFAEKIGVSAQALDNWLNKGYLPRKKLMIIIAKELNMTIDELFFSSQ